MTSNFPPIRREPPTVPTREPLAWERASLEHASAFMEAWRKQWWPIYLHGEIGVGKTCIAALAYSSSKLPGRFFTASEFLSLLMTIRREGKTVLPGSQYEVGEKGFWQSWVDSPPFLVIDDVGIREPTDPQREAIFQLVDRRGLKPTIYTSNLGAGELAALYKDDRIASRLLRGTSLRLDGPDRRLLESRPMVAKAVEVA